MRSVNDLGVRWSGVVMGILLQALAGCSDPTEPSTRAIEAVSVVGVWDWTERISPPGGYTCSDTGSYGFAQVGPTFTGTSDQVGSCSGFGTVIDNTRSELLSGGLVYAGDSVRFAVTTCVYRGVVSGDPASSISGVVTCDTLTRPQGTWQAHPGGPPATVTVSPDSLRQLVGDSARLSVALRDAAGSRVFRRPITWSSSNLTAATVDLTGMVKAVGAGKTTITASAGGASGAGKVAVELGGMFRITNLTGGADLDPTGYVLGAGGVVRGGIGVNTTADLPRLFAGTYSVELSDVASNCTVSGDNPRMLAVTEGATTTSTFQVTCVHTTKLALSSYGSVGVIYADGSNLVTIAAGSAPSWSPDES